MTLEEEIRMLAERCGVRVASRIAERWRASRVGSAWQCGIHVRSSDEWHSLQRTPDGRRLVLISAFVHELRPGPDVHVWKDTQPLARA